MTAPLPTRDLLMGAIRPSLKQWIINAGIRELSCEEYNALESVLADAILARLRPAWDCQHDAVPWACGHSSYPMCSVCADQELNNLRASLARKDEALRACVEALTKIKVATGTPGTLGRQEILDAIFGLADAAL